MTELPTREDLDELVRYETAPCVSIFMPTHRAGRDIEEDPIRLKNLTVEAQRQLEQQGVRSAEARQMLDPARRLIEDTVFWEHQGDGLALFIRPEFMRSFRVPRVLEELAVVAERFHVTPLMPLLDIEHTYYALALSEGRVRLLCGGPIGLEEVDAPDMPKSFADLDRFIDEERQLQFHTVAQKFATAGQESAIFHGHGSASEDAAVKQWLPEFCRMIDRGIEPILRTDQAPLVLAATEPLEAIYRRMNTYAHLLEPSVFGNFDHHNESMLHEITWPVARDHFTHRRDEALRRFHETAPAGRTTQVAELVHEAPGGRVGMLLVAADGHLWGRFDPETLRVEPHHEYQPGDEDLINRAVLVCRAYGAEIYALPGRDMPEGMNVAAVYRF